MCARVNEKEPKGGNVASNVPDEEGHTIHSCTVDNRSQERLVSVVGLSHPSNTRCPAFRGTSTEGHWFEPSTGHLFLISPHFCTFPPCLLFLHQLTLATANRGDKAQSSFALQYPYQSGPRIESDLECSNAIRHAVMILCRLVPRIFLLVLVTVELLLCWWSDRTSSTHNTTAGDTRRVN